MSRPRVQIGEGVLAPLRGAARATALVLWCVLYLTPYSVCLLLRVNVVPVTFLFWRVINAIIGMRVRTHGEVSSARPLLMVANHNSYLDIFAIGSVVPALFVAKADIAHWPAFGLICRLGQTIFVDRRRSQTKKAEAMIQAEMGRNCPIIMFPESTSNSGNYVLPFKSALFTVAERPIDGRSVWVQPVSIALTKVAGLPMGRQFRAQFAWYGDMDLAPHLWHVLKMPSFQIDITFHPALDSAELRSRKVMAKTCETQIATGVGEALQGRAA